MGWISDLFGGGDDDPIPTQVTTTAEQKIPSYIEDYTKEQLSLGGALAERPFTPYPGHLVEGFSDDQKAAFEANRAAQGKWTPAYESARDAAQGVAQGSFKDADIAGYMNPYLSSMKASVGQNFDVAQNALDAKAKTSGAFGSNRRGIADAELATQRGRALGDVDRQAFDNAQKAYYADQQSNLAGAGALSSMAEAHQRMLGKDVGTLSLYGGQQQALGQLNSDANYQQFLREQDFPIEMFNLRQAALGGARYPTSSTSNQNTFTPGGNAFAQNVGALAGLTSGIGNFFATPAKGQSAATGLGNMWTGIKNFF